MRRILPLIIVLGVVIYGGYRIWVQKVAAALTALTGSGTVEATVAEVANDSSERFSAVLVEEGDMVKAGQPLVQLDDTILQAQLTQAQASLQAARGNLAAAQAAAGRGAGQPRPAKSRQPTAGHYRREADCGGRSGASDAGCRAVRAGARGAPVGPGGARRGDRSLRQPRGKGRAPSRSRTPPSPRNRPRRPCASPRLTMTRSR